MESVISRCAIYLASKFSKSVIPNSIMIELSELISVLQLRRHDLQFSCVLYKNLDYVAYSSNLLFNPTRRRLLAYSISHFDKWNFLRYLFFYSDIPVFSTQQDLES